MPEYTYVIKADQQDGKDGHTVLNENTSSELILCIKSVKHIVPKSAK
jgi:hypothetical protein